MDAESCYRAVESRDARFAGRFYVAVRTTGVYCRPGCPARLPRRDNVRFYPSAAAAESDGFRACLRCRPDAAPPAWAGTERTLTRALRLLEETGEVAGLADRLGVGARHLRRLFAQHLGASPAQVLHTRRLQIARQVLEGSDLPMLDVAHASGFASLRRFNEAVRRGFGRTPSELRRSAGSSGVLELQLPFRPPLDFEGMLRFMQPRMVPGIELVRDGAWFRTAREGTIEIRRGGPRSLLLRLPLSLSPQAFSLVARAQRLFDLRADPEPIARHLREDFGSIAPRVPGAWEPFEMAVRAIVGQQISVPRATVLMQRIAEEHGERVPSGLLFPSPEKLASVEVRGMPGQRSRAISALARAVAGGTLRLEGGERVVEQLCEIPGIGDWTAQVIAMRALGEPDAFPAGDLGLQRASGLSGKALLARAERWRPWRAYAASALWMKGHE